MVDLTIIPDDGASATPAKKTGAYTGPPPPGLSDADIVKLKTMGPKEEEAFARTYASAAPTAPKTHTLTVMPGGPVDPSGAAFEAPSRVEKFTGATARDIEKGLKKVGLPNDVAEEAGNILYKAGPHDWTDAAFQVAGLLIPFAKVAAPIFEESAPFVSKFLNTVGGGGMAGVGARAGLTAAATGGTAAATGEPVAPAVATGAVGSVAGELPAVAGAHLSGVSSAERAVTESAAETSTKQAETHAISRGLGVTPDAAATLATESPESAHTVANVKRALTATRNAVFEEKGAKFEPFYGPQNDRPLDPSEIDRIHEGSANGMAITAERGQERELSAGVKKQITDLGNMKTVSDSDARTILKQAFEDQHLARTEQRHPELIEAIKAADAKRVADGKPPLSMDDLSKLVQVQQGTTIGQLRGKLSSLMGEARGASATPTDRRAIFEATRPITRILDDAVPDELRPALQKVKDEYAQAIHLFPWRQQRALQVASTLPELGATFFEKSNPAVIEGLVKRMDPQGQALMRESLGAYVWHQAESDPVKALKLLADNQASIKLLFPNTEFAEIGTWAGMIQGTNHLRKQSLAQLGLPSRREFYNALGKTLEKDVTPKQVEAAEEALRESTVKPFQLRWAERMAVLGPLAGFGAFYRKPWLYGPLVMYELGRMGWKSLVAHPEALSMYRTAIMNPTTRAGGDALGRLLISGTYNFIKGAGKELPAAAPPPPAAAPSMGALAQQWKLAQSEDKHDQMASARDEMMARLQTGEFKKLPPQEKAKLAPLLAEMLKKREKPAEMGTG